MEGENTLQTSDILGLHNFHCAMAHVQPCIALVTEPTYAELVGLLPEFFF